MDALATARRSAGAIGLVPAGFMLDPATYEHGSSLGFAGTDFYFGGRAGPLGDVDATVVAAALVFFEPATVAAAWERAGAVRPRREAAREFAGCGHRWAEAHLPDGIDYGRLGALAAKVITGASPAGAPLFAAWVAMDEPSSPKALALHRLNILRELRGALHGGAVLAEGLSPFEALSVRTPFMAALFGWGQAMADTEPHEAAWSRAEEGTDRAMARHLAPLGDGERDDLVELCDALTSAGQGA